MFSAFCQQQQLAQLLASRRCQQTDAMFTWRSHTVCACLSQQADLASLLCSHSHSFFNSIAFPPRLHCPPYCSPTLTPSSTQSLTPHSTLSQHIHSLVLPTLLCSHSHSLLNSTQLLSCTSPLLPLALSSLAISAPSSIFTHFMPVIAAAAVVVAAFWVRRSDVKSVKLELP